MTVVLFVDLQTPFQLHWIEYEEHCKYRNGKLLSQYTNVLVLLQSPKFRKDSWRSDRK